ncbi:hypothetical protein GCM10011490_23990 [Pseudoclavibacter endophyticus]|uniref:Helix-turn-helix domain-containing protein n=1 Tax=Pseudoclavibacter endophyticus TaxID=1778590 RepID=A0A6H9WH79_9MICO|nr:hypothetical protein [Pseudoclavibacter endophyticus]KAB1648404.1 hypothetical protein F8O04_12015 [Pseudoclavibacter endophyticus]GGA72413.1 hypothetical protein GCM10011490_23990 [Pseudoclavibacter endophyticus]
MTSTSLASLDGVDHGALPVYLTPEQVCDRFPGLTKGNLAQRRYKGLAPKWLSPTPRTILYRESDVVAWIEASERTITGDAG